LTKKTCFVILVSLLVISTLTLAFKIQIVKADVGTIYIRADGSIDPPTAPIYTADNITYTLTGNIVANVLTDGIMVERENITVDGVGYTVQGTGAANSGIHVEGRNNITIKSITIREFENGIWLNYSSNDNISGNNIANNTNAIHVVASNRTSVVGNNVINNDEGIHVEGSMGISVAGNNITQVGAANQTVASHAIDVVASQHISVSGNHIEQVGTNENLSVSHAIHVVASNGTNVVGNTVINNDEGIHVEGSMGISVFGNNITKNGVGIVLNSSSSISIYHNNFINNTQQVENQASTNLWDNGYPSGGNYWSEYNGTDIYMGLYQNETGNDGIGDTSYGIDANNTDNYPLMFMWMHIVGDLNFDGKVSLADLTILAYSYNSMSVDLNWNPLADLAPPYGIISLTDVVTLAMHYGQHYP
jgi:parallel beta-helix repeat protein